MSVHWSNAKKRFFICYKEKRPDGTFKTVSIYNRLWTKERGKRYVQQIEEAIVREAKKGAKPRLSIGKGASIFPFLDRVEKEWETEYKAQTAYHKIHIVEQFPFINSAPNIPVNAAPSRALSHFMPRT